MARQTLVWLLFAIFVLARAQDDDALGLDQEGEGLILNQEGFNAEDDQGEGVDLDHTEVIPRLTTLSLSDDGELVPMDLGFDTFEPAPLPESQRQCPQWEYPNRCQTGMSGGHAGTIESAVMGDDVVVCGKIVKDYADPDKQAASKRELEFYQNVFGQTQSGLGEKQPITKYMPEFFGLCVYRTTVQDQPAELKYTLMENLKAGFDKPQELDIKIGTHTACNRDSDAFKRGRHCLLDLVRGSRGNGFRVEGKNQMEDWLVLMGGKKQAIMTCLLYKLIEMLEDFVATRDFRYMMVGSSLLLTYDLPASSTLGVPRPSFAKSPLKLRDSFRNLVTRSSSVPKQRHLTTESSISFNTDTRRPGEYRALHSDKLPAAYKPLTPRGETPKTKERKRTCGAKMIDFAHTWTLTDAQFPLKGDAKKAVEGYRYGLANLIVTLQKEFPRGSGFDDPPECLVCAGIIAGSPELAIQNVEEKVEEKVEDAEDEVDMMEFLKA